MFRAILSLVNQCSVVTLSLFSRKLMLNLYAHILKALKSDIMKLNSFLHFTGSKTQLCVRLLVSAARTMFSLSAALLRSQN